MFFDPNATGEPALAQTIHWVLGHWLFWVGATLLAAIIPAAVAISLSGRHRLSSATATSSLGHRAAIWWLWLAVGLLCTGALSVILGQWRTPVDTLYHDSYFSLETLNDFHIAAILSGVFAWLYLKFDALLGAPPPKRAAQAHFWLSGIGSLIALAPLALLGTQGMPRRYLEHNNLGLATRAAELAAMLAIVLSVLGFVIFLVTLVSTGMRARQRGATSKGDDDGPKP